MKYDITAKRLLEEGKEEILKYFLNIDVEKVDIIEEIPSETVSIRSTDFPLIVKEKSGNEYILLLEIQSNWREEKIYDIIDYWTRFKRKYGLEIRCAMILLSKHGKARGDFVSDSLSFSFELIKIWEYEPEDIFNLKLIQLIPFIPLMKNGTEYVDTAVDNLYYCEIKEEIKSDYLTALAFFTGMRDIKLAKALFEKRRDLMIESPVYDWILEEGIEKGVEQGIKKNTVETVKKMFQEGIAVDVIERITGLSREKILALKDK